MPLGPIVSLGVRAHQMTMSHNRCEFIVELVKRIGWELDCRRLANWKGSPEVRRWVTHKNTLAAEYYWFELREYAARVLLQKRNKPTIAANATIQGIPWSNRMSTVKTDESSVRNAPALE